ncbi:MAG TPA: type II toxin-antitoxin system VapB family antitoxin [Stellaceae bacterium]|jgi:antitoxin VapB|nr:type II toxin-antitoxin system VapB family antitoxin [Stellaceae bacterium]
MAFHVRDEETDVAVRRLAKRKGKTLTATIREACQHEYESAYGGESDFMKAVREAQDAFRKLGKPTGLKADKAFYDELSGEDELTGLP